jgi:gamma-glutamylcyclotransferase (GGCT)/AIG2-like uncharacterized protein YtfP
VQHLVFVYGTLLKGEANHRLLAGAEPLGTHRTRPCFTLLDLGAYPGAVAGGATAIGGEVYRIDGGTLARLDRLEEYPRLYDRRPIDTPYGRAWIYLYRGRRADRPAIPWGDWRAHAAEAGSIRSAGVRATRDPKNRRPRHPGHPIPSHSIASDEEPPMSEEGRFTIRLEQQEGYRIAVAFDWKRVAPLTLDEPPPLGEQSGPNASRLLAAAAADCLAASLLFCVFKDEPPPQCLRAEATCIMVRNEKRRLRIGALEVRLIVSDQVKDNPRFARCKDLFEDFCVVWASIRQGIPMRVSVVDEQGELLHSSE